MLALVLGLIVFMGVHSIRIVSDEFRTRQIERIGMGTWRGMYAALSLVGFVLIVVGYGVARTVPYVIWYPPVWTAHVAMLLTIPAFILIASSFVPGTRIRKKLGHPMVLGIKIWAFAHLLANGMLADILLFGTFLVWSIAAYASGRRRDRKAGTVYPVGPVLRDVIAVVAGLAAWLVFAMWLHVVLIGVAPMRVAVAGG
jgi:uncharacterized membrane protein